MRVKTVIEDRFPKKRIKAADRVVWATSLVAETGFNTMLPFAFGFYFAKTTHLIFVFLFLINVLFNIKVGREGRRIKIKITRGI